MKKIRNDILLGVCVLVLAGGLYLILGMLRISGGQAVVSVDGAEFGRYSLAEDCRIAIPGKDGGCNLLVISDGAAQIEQATCPDKVCVKMGTVQYRGETIVCLPNGVTVTVEGGKSGKVDGIAR